MFTSPTFGISYMLPANYGVNKSYDNHAPHPDEQYTRREEKERGEENTIFTQLCKY